VAYLEFRGHSPFRFQKSEEGTWVIFQVYIIKSVPNLAYFSHCIGLLVQFSPKGVPRNNPVNTPLFKMLRKYSCWLAENGKEQLLIDLMTMTVTKVT